MEGVGLRMFAGVYSGCRVLVTGHTGFKGSWLALWLQRLGAQVAGLALPAPGSPSHWELLGLDIDARTTDIRDAAAVLAAVAHFRPEIVFHLAAQALVRPSYDDPLATWSTNVMGTAHVLEACRHVSGLRAIVVATSDKCYANREWHWAYRESDPLGGHDPYSASKAGAEMVAASYRQSFFAPAGRTLLATARAGNVIGGGDWGQDRLVPDAARAVAGGAALQVRNPQATRPWQHVLEPLSGYLMLGQKLLQGERAAADAWNFGPGPEGNVTVSALLDTMRGEWPELRWQAEGVAGPHEARLLHLDSARARAELQWQPVWSLPEGAAATAAWYRGWLAERQVRSGEQLDAYIGAARTARLAWARP